MMKFSWDAPRLLYVAALVFVFVGAAAAGYYFVPYIKDMNREVPQVTPSYVAPTDTPVVETPVEEVTPVVDLSGRVITLEGDDLTLAVAWQEPQKISPLGILKDETVQPDYESYEYFRVGKVKSGVFAGADIVNLIWYYGGLQIFPDLDRFLVASDKIIWLGATEDRLYPKEDEYDYGNALVVSKLSVAPGLTIPELEQIPGTIEGPKARQTLRRDTSVVEMFSLKDLRKVFTHSTLGDVYTTDSAVVSYDPYIFARNGFYARAADGMTIVYMYEPDFLEQLTPQTTAVPNITFTDGSKNQQGYTFSSLTGCGSSNYANVADAKVETTDLVKVGTTSKGDAIYELAYREYDDIPLAEHQKAGKLDAYDSLKQAYDYWVPFAGQSKITYEEFLKQHPLIFNRDPFGRLIEGLSSQFIPPVECGKPVIYLYPEQTQDVSVKVEPQGGFSYTDPEYGNGWFVRATPEGELTELSSGKTYPYLFWEGRGGIYETPKRGFVVSQAEVESFLDDSLAQLGLNAQETADFKEFWLPRMQSAPYYFIAFLGNVAMDELAPLTVEPKPDTVIRVLMDFTPLEQPIEVQGYELRSPARKGFTVVEWGGVLR